MKRFIKVLVFSALSVITASSILLCCGNPGDNQKNAATTKESYHAEYAGRNTCASCHEMQNDLFHGSDHDMAMDVATDESVLGDFNNSSFEHLGITSRFYKKEEGFFVYTEGTGGEMKEFKIAYTFGIDPLQQYLIEFPDGAYQCLPVAWNTLPESQGGQKWFHLYGEERIGPDDILFWTRTTQNWNYMCSECHSTNVRKRYDYQSRSYNTQWNEIDVSCESCHGPGSMHIDWAEKVENGSSPDIFPNMGLVVRLKDTDNATWVFDPDSTTARRSVPRSNDDLVQMCARCHSRRSVITEEYYHGGSLLDTHWPSLLDEGLYFADGQIQDEVYVYGSFLQSKMYMAGVQCKDCHETHSGNLYVNGNALCYRCHLASEYSGRDHHHHDPAGEGADCAECHMHERTYMVYDPRRDHSIRIPRPDLSDKLGTPNACIQCHSDKSNQWASSYLEKWYGKELLNTEHYGEVFWAGRKAYPEALPKLIQLGNDSKSAPMVRATAISLLMNYQDPSIIPFLVKMLTDKDPLIRYASLNLAQFVDMQQLANPVIECLDDSVKLVRIMAANALAGFDTDQLPANKKKLFENSLAEYIESLMINSDHPGTHINFGNLYLARGDQQKAEASYREAIEIEPGLVTAYINLADLLRRQNRDAEGEELLLSALQKYPDMAAVNYALGLLKVRKQEQGSALVYLKAAADNAPEVPRYAYVYAVGMNSSGKPSEAISILEKSLKLHPYDRDILYTLTTINLEQGDKEDAKKYASMLAEYYPEDENYRQVLAYIASME